MYTARTARDQGLRVNATTRAGAVHTGLVLYPVVDVLNLNVNGAVFAIPMEELTSLKFSYEA